jgi:hypothetical protein
MTTSISDLEAQLKIARAQVKMKDFGTEAFEQSMSVVRNLIEQIQLAQPVEEYCSIDSGVHRTRLPNGRIV